jgi:superfamily II DNA or RNA helicase
MRPHQVNGVQMLRIATAEEKRRIHERPVRIVFAAPCSWGKTNAAANMFTTAISKGLRCLFTVPRLTLVEQAYDDFLADGLTSLGIIQGNHPKTNPYAALQIASVQTLVNREVPIPDFVIVDECHLQFKGLNELLDSEEWKDVIVIGLTGTPGARGMGKHWHRIVIPATLKQQMEARLMSSYVAYAPASEYEPDMSGVKITAGEFNEKQAAAVMSDAKLVGHVVDHWLAKGEGKPTFLYGVDCGHAQLLQRQFIEHGIPWSYMDGDTPFDGPGGRKEIFAQLERGEIRGVASVGTLIEGVNAPHVGCIIDCQPSKSRMRQGQKIPRMLRLDPNDPDKVAILLDHAGNCQRKGMGLVEDFVWDHLDDGKPKTKEQKAKEERESKPPRKCKCGALLPVATRKCPKCGYERERTTDIQHVPGQLVPLGSGQKGKKGADKVPPEVKARFYAELRGYAAAYGKKDGWAYYKFKEKYGVFPSGNKPDPQPASFETSNWVRARNIAFVKAKEKAAKAVAQ